MNRTMIDLLANTPVQCPYDKSHMILPNRMPYHLMKCRKNFPTMELAVCPFNATHEVHKVELRYHMMHCPERTLVDKKKIFDLTDNGVQRKGNTDLPKYSTVTFDDTDDENCDDDPEDTTVPRSSDCSVPRIPGFSEQRYNFHTQIPSDRGGLRETRLPQTKGKAAEMSREIFEAQETANRAKNKKQGFDYNFLGMSLGRGRRSQCEKTVSTSQSSHSNSSNHHDNRTPLPSHSENMPYQCSFPFSSIGRGRGIFSLR